MVICLSSFFVARSAGKKGGQKGSAAVATQGAHGGGGVPHTDRTALSWDAAAKQSAAADVEAAAAAEGDEEDRPLLAAVREGLGRRRTTSDQDVRGGA